MERTQPYYLLVAALALLSASVAPGRAQNTPSADEAIKTRIESKLFDEGLMGVHVDVHERTVTLSGSIESLWLKNQAIREARKVRDVKDIVSTLSIPRGESDEALAAEIAAEVSGSVYFSIFDDVSVRVADGSATLTGYVTSPNKSEEFTTDASKIPGVQQVVNRIEALPASMMDDDLRYAVSMTIYTHPMFAPYALQRVGPIHIIVRRAHVTLTGVAASEAERQVAEMLTRGVGGVMGVKNELRLAEKSDPAT